MKEAEIKAAALVIRQRCCRARDGRDITESEGIEIARDALRAAERERGYLSGDDLRSGNG